MKDILRRQIVAKKRLLSPGEIKRSGQVITWIVCKLPQWQSARIISVYRSLATEVDTREIIRQARHEKKTVLYPDSQQGADLYIVPGLAFDRKGNRLGRGRGYYDRLLSGVAAPKIGLAFDIQVVAEVPCSSYDVPMDMVITERGIYAKKNT